MPLLGEVSWPWPVTVNTHYSVRRAVAITNRSTSYLDVTAELFAFNAPHPPAVGVPSPLIGNASDARFCRTIQTYGNANRWGVC
jgi:hypothetical protein